MPTRKDEPEIVYALGPAKLNSQITAFYIPEFGKTHTKRFKQNSGGLRARPKVTDHGQLRLLRAPSAAR
jgi:hypothetical protein